MELPARATPPALLALVLMFAGCASTEHGEHPIMSSGASNPVVTHAETSTAPVIVPQAVAPPILPTHYTPSPPVQFSAPKTIEDSGAGAAVLSLAKKAEEDNKAGHPERAESALTRALHIEPRNPFIWQMLASVHLAERQYDLAQNEAQKSTSLGRGNPWIEAGNLRIVADTRDAKGDAKGALQARTQADDLLSGNGAAAPQSQ